MPIYEYECLSCAHRFDEMQRFSDPPITACPECHSPVRKILFPAAVIFKGSGFYATEYGRSKPSSSSNSESSKDSSKDATKTSTAAAPAASNTTPSSGSGSGENSGS